jgi:hypothetical protein
MCWVDGRNIRVYRRPSPTGKTFSTPYYVCCRRNHELLFHRGFIDYPTALLFAHWCIENFDDLKPARRPWNDRHLLGPIVENKAQEFIAPQKIVSF